MSEPAAITLSFIIPSYQQGGYLQQCLDSIAAQQLPRDQIEILVYDGGSTDNTVDILQAHPLRPTWKSGLDGGQAQAINTGLQEARGEILAWINSDDYYPPGALAKVLAFFRDNPGESILYGQADYVDDDGQLLRPYPVEEWDYRRLAEICYICQPAVFFRRSIPLEYGLLDETLQCSLDYEYWLRIGKRQRFFHLKEKLACSRLHEETKTLRLGMKVEAESLFAAHRHTGSWPDKWKDGWARRKADSWLRENPADGRTEERREALLRRARQYLELRLAWLSPEAAEGYPPEVFWTVRQGDFAEFLDLLDKNETHWHEHVERLKNETRWLENLSREAARGREHWETRYQEERARWEEEKAAWISEKEWLRQRAEKAEADAGHWKLLIQQNRDEAEWLKQRAEKAEADADHWKELREADLQRATADADARRDEMEWLKQRTEKAEAAQEAAQQQMEPLREESKWLRGRIEALEQTLAAQEEQARLLREETEWLRGVASEADTARNQAVEEAASRIEALLEETKWLRSVVHELEQAREDQGRQLALLQEESTWRKSVMEEQEHAIAALEKDRQALHESRQRVATLEAYIRELEQQRWIRAGRSLKTLKPEPPL